MTLMVNLRKPNEDFGGKSMRKRRLMALAMAAMMMSNTAVGSAWAEIWVNDKQITETVIDGDVKGEADGWDTVSVDEGDTLHVKGSVTTDKEASDAVYADNATVIVDGDAISENNNGVTANDGANVTIKGNSSTIDANEKSTVEVGGSVIDLDGVDAENESKVTIKGNIKSEVDGIFAEEKSTVTVGGDVTAGRDGVYAGNGSTIAIGGDVKAGGRYALSIDESTITVGGNVEGNTGIQAFEDDTSVTVKGDLTANDGKDILMTGGTINIEGNIKAGNDKKIGIDIAYGNGENGRAEIAVGGKIENADADATLRINYKTDLSASENVPELVVGEIEDMSKLTVTNWDGSKLPEKVEKDILSSIKYIVNTKEAANGTIKVTKVNGGALDKDKSGNYNVAKESETLNIHIDVAEGYEVAEVKAGKATATLVKNTDGSYSVKVPAGGGVSIEAIMKAIEKADDTKKDDDKKDDNNNSGTVIEIPITPTRSTSHESHSERVDAAEKASTWTLYADHKTYTKANGERARNEWVEIMVDGQKKWFYFGYDYAMETGWKQLNGVWYFLNDGSVAGIPVGGWVEGMTK